MNPRYPSSFAWIATAGVSLLLVGSAFADNPVPQVVGPPIPQAVVPGSAEFTLTVYGANFVSGAVVNWNGQPRSTTFISARELQAQILASDVAKPTAGYITVTNPPPGGGKSSSSYAIVEVHHATKTINPGPYKQYFSGNVPWYAVAADFTHDGKLDLATGFNVIDFSKGNGDGTFQPGYTVGGNYYGGCGIAFGDFNDDDNLDLVYGWGPENGPPTYLRVLLGKGNGRFHGLPLFGFLLNDLATGIVAADFNGDGKLDLAAGYEGGIRGGDVYLGNGDGTFRKVWHLGEGGSIAAADFNGDGKLDLVVDDQGYLFVMIGNGDGTFQKEQKIAQVLGGGLAVNDFNGDGIADIAFADEVKERIGVLIGNGDGTFKKPTFYPVGFTPNTNFEFAVGDFNSDGNTDVIVSQIGIPAKFEILLGNGDGTFQKAQKLHLAAATESGIVVGDFNSDGLLDFVLLGDGVFVYLQK